MKLPEPAARSKVEGFYTEAQMREMYCQAIDDAIDMIAFNGGTVQQEEDEGCWKCGEDGGTSCGDPNCGLLVTEDELKDRRITELEAQNKQLLEALKRLMRGTTTMQEAMDANQQARAAIAKYGEQK